MYPYFIHPEHQVATHELEEQSEISPGVLLSSYVQEYKMNSDLDLMHPLFLEVHQEKMC